MLKAAIKVGPTDHGRRMSLADFDHAEIQEGYFYELGRGVIVVSDVPKKRHLYQVESTRDQIVAYKLAHPGRIQIVAGGGDCKIMVAGYESERHPDLAVYKTPPPEEEEDFWSTWIPELVIEVVSPGSELRDYQEKREEYLAFGVHEYWILDAEKQEMLVLQRSVGAGVSGSCVRPKFISRAFCQVFSSPVSRFFKQPRQRRIEISMANPCQDSADPVMPRLGQSTPLVPPLYLSSVYTLPDLDALDQILDATEPGFIYARDSHPNARYLAEQLRVLESAAWAVVCGSGMAAITSILMAVAKQGDRIVASNSLYGRTTQLLNQELTRFGVQTATVECRDLKQVRAAFEKPARVLFVETMSNPLLVLADLAALAGLAHEHDCLFVVDNTFATPVLTRPLELGADCVVESLTKMIGGHSDVTLGVVCGMGDLLPQVNQTVSIWGLASNPFDCWLASRGLPTLPLRMQAASANASALADWLAEQTGVTRVLYPGRSDHPDHEVAGRVLKGGFGNMISFELDGGRDAVNRFMRKAKGIPFSPSLGNTTTTCSHPGTTSHRYVSPAEKRRLGISDGLIRLSVGIEDREQIQHEIAKGLE